jgi:hypothetical protein
MMPNIGKMCLIDVKNNVPCAFGKFPGFSIPRSDPALCGLFMAMICDDYHKTAIDMASNQGQIIVTAHLYNAARSKGSIPLDLRWTDMDWLIEKQGADWMFIGKQPSQNIEFGKRLNLIMGYPLHKFTKDHMSRRGGPGPKTVAGGMRRLGYHARYTELSYDKEPRYKKPTGDSKAKDDILIMLESLVKDYLGKDHDTRKELSFLDKPQFFKLAIKKDEPALAFDFLDMNLRCIRLLQETQRYALAVAPHDYRFVGLYCGLGNDGHDRQNDVRLRRCATKPPKHIPRGSTNPS